MNTPEPCCPDDTVLARAVSHGADEALATHLRGCQRCATVLREHRELVELAARLPAVTPTHDRLRRVRAALLTPQPTGRTGVGWLGLGGGLLVAAALLLLFLPLRKPLAPPTPASRAVIEAASGARFERLSGPPHEVVRLYEGTIRTTVPPATHGETVRILTGAGEVEVHGTVFDTTAESDRLIAVKVQRGRVIVRAPGTPGATGARTELALDAGRSWQRPVEPAPAVQPLLPEGPPPLRLHHRAKARPQAPARKPDPAEQAVADGLALLRASNLPAAAQAFDRALKLAPQGNLAEDATFWRAVALAGSPGGEDALVTFLDRFPQSARAGEISVMLGWRLVDRDANAAAVRFDAGLSDRSARVRKSARAGIEAAARKGAADRQRAGQDR
jgi:hypothetical protein